MGFDLGETDLEEDMVGPATSFRGDNGQGRRRISAQHPARIGWECCMLACLVYNCWSIPFRVSFSPEYTFTSVWSVYIALDYFTDLLYFVDIALRIRYFEGGRAYQYSDKFRAFVSSPKSSGAMAYLKGMFVIDMISVLPYAAIAYAAGYARRPKMLPCIAVFRLPRFLRLLRLPSCLGVIRGMLERRNLLVNAGSQRVALLWSAFFMLGHWVACGWFGIARTIVMGGSNETWAINDCEGANWTIPNGIGCREILDGSLEAIDPTVVMHAYTRSLYWALITMVTVGLGDIVPAPGSESETIFTVLTMYTGVFLTCTVIGNLTNLVANLDAAEDEFHSKMDNLNKYMAYRHLSQDLRERIRAYYQYIWYSLKGMNEQQFLKDLPSSLRLQVAGLRSRDLVHKVTFFKKAREPLLNAICFNLEQIVVSPGDRVVVEGQSVHGVHFLGRGEAELLSPGSNGVLQNLSGKFGSHFGESSLFFSSTHKNTVKTKSYCEFFFLPREKFDKIAKAHCTAEELAEMKQAAEKAMKREAKVKKFFGLDTESGPQKKNWRRHFEPNAHFRHFWDIVCLMGILYQAFFIPLRISFIFRRGGDCFDDLNVLNSTSTIQNTCNEDLLPWDIMFVVDIFFKAQLFAFTKEGVVVANRARIFNRYRKMRDFYVDVSAAVPLDVIYAAVPPSVAGISLLPLLRLNKMLRCYHLQYHLDKAQEFLTELKFSVTNSFSRLFRMFLYVLLFVHWTGCIFLLMAEITIHDTANDCDISKKIAKIENRSHSCLECRSDWVCYDIENEYNYIDFGPGSDSAEILYLRAVYFVLVDMTTVGYGDITPRNTHETFYVVVITLFGGLVYPAVVGAMAALISNLNALQAQFKNKVSTLTKYMELKGFPEDLKMRIVRYYDYLWSRQRGVDEDVILNDLPSPLRMEVQQFINGSIIRQIPFFVGMDPDLIRHLLSVLKPAVFLPNDFIIRAGEFGQEMYLLERGATRVTSPDGGMTYAVLTQGDYFGEGCLLKAEKRTAAIRAVGYCDCFVLNRADFEQVSLDFPECREMLLRLLSNTLQSKKRQNAKVTSNFKLHPKLSQTTSFEDDARKEVPLTSIRHPESRKRLYWDSVLLLVCLVNATAVPYRLAFPEGVDWHFYFFDYTLDLALFIDIAFAYYVFGYIFEGKVFTDQDDIMSNYRHSRRFWPDMIASFPFEVLVLIPVLANPGKHDYSFDPTFMLVLALARVPKLVRLLRVSDYSMSFAQLVEESQLFSHIFLKLLYLLTYVMLICHWMACGFYLVARYNDREGDFEDTCNRSETHLVRDWNDTEGACPSESLFNNSIPEMGMCGSTDCAYRNWKMSWMQLQMDTGLINVFGGTPPERYLRALYWAVPTLVVVVIGDVIPVTNEGTAYVAIGIFIGVTINATIIGNIANLVANLEGDSAAFRERKDELEKFLHLYQLPKSVKERARRYYQYVFETQKGFDQSAIIKDLPATLRQEVSSFLKLSFVQKCPFFEFCDPALTKALAYSLTSRVYSPDDFIVHEGDLGREMFFIERGMVQMVSENHSRKDGDKGDGSRMRNSIQLSFSLRLVGSSTICNHQDQTVDNRYTVLSTCSAGQFFGETALFFAERRSCSVRCIDYCELYVLHKSDLEELLRRYPFERDRMFQAVSELQAENIRRNTKVKENFEHKVHEGTKLFQYFRSSSSVVVSRLKYNRFFTPGAYFVQMWNLINLLLMIYFLISIPYRMAFYVPYRAPFKGSTLPADVLAWFCLDYVVDIFFLVDMYLQGAKFAFLDEGKLVNDPILIFARYRKNLLRNIIANLPVDIALIPIYFTSFTSGRPFEPSADVVSSCSFITLMAWLRAVHLLRLFDLPQQISNLQVTLADWRVRTSSPMIQVIKMCFILFAINHVYACTWFMIHRFLEHGIPNTWAVVDNLAEFDPLKGKHNVMRESSGDELIPMHLRCYIRAFYFTITTLSTVGYGDIRPYTSVETVFELIVVTSGACVFAAIIGSIAVLFYSMDSTGDIAFKDKLRKVKSYMKYRQLPKGLQKQILNHFVTLWDRQKGVVLKDILADLPVPMQLDIAYYVNREVIRKTPGLRKCSKQVQKNIALALSPQVCSPGDFVYRAGDIGHEIYFILYGEVNVLVDGGKTVTATLSAGDFFGETVLQTASGERKESVRAVTQCDLYYMHKSRLDDILSDYPEENGSACKLPFS